MMRLDMTRVCVITALAIGAGGAARADLTLSATDNATVQSGGPRLGGNGKNFLNMEGSANNQFASFGVVDFATTGAAPITGLGLLRVQLVEANASFTGPGSLNFYLSTSTATNIQPRTSTLVYNPALAPKGLGTQLDPKFLLGAGTFSSMGVRPRAEWTCTRSVCRRRRPHTSTVSSASARSESSSRRRPRPWPRHSRGSRAISFSARG